VSDEAALTKKRRNWWKLAFFIALLAFEITRELLVIQSGSPASITAMKHITHFKGWVSASGRWWRVDGGGSLVPGAVTIECRPETGQCVEAATTVMNGVMPPTMDTFQARWDDSSVSYVNDNADCARYSVRIDWKEERATATRVRKANPSNPNCAMLEPKLDMELGDGYKSGEARAELDKHFVPVLQLFMGVVRMFD
jgi:hypothetical protein